MTLLFNVFKILSVVTFNGNRTHFLGVADLISINENKLHFSLFQLVFSSRFWTLYICSSPAIIRGIGHLNSTSCERVKVRAKSYTAGRCWLCWQVCCEQVSISYRRSAGRAAVWALCCWSWAYTRDTRPSEPSPSSSHRPDLHHRAYFPPHSPRWSPHHQTPSSHFHPSFYCRKSIRRNIFCSQQWLLL